MENKINLSVSAKEAYWQDVIKDWEKGRFQFPDNYSSTPLCIGVKELQWILAGFHFSELRKKLFSNSYPYNRKKPNSIIRNANH